jgi:hypothetical protein
MIDCSKRIVRRVELVIAVVAVLGLTVWVASSDARTWYIRADGTGDAPTIQAGLDSATAGDIVLLGSGTYYVNDQNGIDIPPGVVVTSESGPAATIVQASVVPTYALFGVGAGSEVSGLWMKPVQVTTVSAYGPGARISHNIIEAFSFSDGGILVYGQATITNNLIMGGSTGIRFMDCPSETVVENNIILNGVICGACPFYGGYCNVVRGTIVGTCVFGYDVDPQFCGTPGSGNYYLQADSPCAPGRIDYCGLIGPLPVGCGSVATEEKTWGAIKAIYQE